MAKILALYLPVLHEGYRLFLEQNQDAQGLFLFDRQFLRTWPEFDYLKKDLRAVDSDVMAKAVRALWPSLKIETVKNSADFEKFLKIAQTVSDQAEQEWLLSDDDLGHYLAEKYLSQATIKFNPVFLRWDKNRILQEQDPEPNRKITQEEFEQNIMRQAFSEASKSSDWWRRVGVLILKDGQVLLAAHNQHLPSNQEQNFHGDPRAFFSSGECIELSSSVHAEALAIARAAALGIPLAGADLFVTTFPCPVCAKQIVSAGIKRVFYATGYAVLDGLKILETAGIEIIEVQFADATWKELAEQEASASNIKECYA